MLNVKAGDKVLVTSPYNRYIEKVKKVTPTGNIRLENGEYYNKFGRVKSNDVWKYSHLMELTKDLEEKILREDYIKDTMMILKNLKELTFEQAVAIRKTLHEKQVKQ